MQRWQREGQNALEGPAQYYQPRYWCERWRLASLRDASGQLTPAGFAFADAQAAPAFDGNTWPIHELFPELPIDPADAEDSIREAVTPQLMRIAERFFAHAGKTANTDWNRAVRDLQCYFEPEGPSLELWKKLTRHAIEQLPEQPTGEPVGELADALTPLAREVAKIDGYDVWRRSAAIDLMRPATSRKCWAVPLRTWAVDADWRSADGTLQGSHDATGQVRPEYVAEKLPMLYEDDTLNTELLDPDCIEGRDWNLSAGQYKPFDFAEMAASDVSVTQLLEQLHDSERNILEGLKRLQGMLGDQA
jgi:type I restriction enzyme M protein